MTESRVVQFYRRSTDSLCDWLANDHPALTPGERLDLALIIEDQAAQLRKLPASGLFVQRFGGRQRRGRTQIGSDEQLLQVAGWIKTIEQAVGPLSAESREHLLSAAAKRLGYKGRRELEQAIEAAKSRA